MDHLHSTTTEHRKGEHLSFENRILIQTRLFVQIYLRIRPSSFIPCCVPLALSNASLSIKFFGRLKSYLPSCHYRQKHGFLRLTFCLGNRFPPVLRCFCRRYPSIVLRAQRLLTFSKQNDRETPAVLPVHFQLIQHALYAFISVHSSSCFRAGIFLLLYRVSVYACRISVCSEISLLIVQRSSTESSATL